MFKKYISILAGLSFFFLSQCNLVAICGEDITLDGEVDSEDIGSIETRLKKDPGHNDLELRKKHKKKKNKSHEKPKSFIRGEIEEPILGLDDIEKED